MFLITNEDNISHKSVKPAVCLPVGELRIGESSIRIAARIFQFQRSLRCTKHNQRSIHVSMLMLLGFIETYSIIIHSRTSSCMWLGSQCTANS